MGFLLSVLFSVTYGTAKHKTLRNVNKDVSRNQTVGYICQKSDTIPCDLIWYGLKRYNRVWCSHVFSCHLYLPVPIQSFQNGLFQQWVWQSIDVFLFSMLSLRQTLRLDDDLDTGTCQGVWLVYEIIGLFPSLYPLTFLMLLKSIRIFEPTFIFSSTLINIYIPFQFSLALLFCLLF